MDDSTQASSARRVAEQVAAAMLAADPATRGLGITLVAASVGTTRLRMPVRADMVQAHGTCHGGLIFALADSAFAFACGSRNERVVGAGCQIDYLQPAQEGDVLEAEAGERALSGRTGIYDVTVRNQRQETVALFRGKSRRLNGPAVTGLDVDA